MPESSVLQDDLKLVTRAAEHAGQIAMGYFRKDPEVWYKGGTSPVSEADIAVDRYLQETLRQARPNYGWLSEETEDDHSRFSGQPVFVVDPIDGTRAYIRGDDLWCVSVAVVRDGRPDVGVLACPARGELFTAASDRGTLQNGKAVHVAAPGSTRKIAAPKSVLSKLPEGLLEGLEQAPHVSSLAYRLAMVADGRLAATYVKPNSNDWDLAAADLILEKAGGAIVDIDGARLRYNDGDTTHGILIAAPGDMLPTMREAIIGIDF